MPRQNHSTEVLVQKFDAGSERKHVRLPLERKKAQWTTTIDIEDFSKRQCLAEAPRHTTAREGIS